MRARACVRARVRACVCVYVVLWFTLRFGMRRLLVRLCRFRFVLAELLVCGLVGVALLADFLFVAVMRVALLHPSVCSFMCACLHGC